MIQTFIDYISTFITLSKKEEEYMRANMVIEAFDKDYTILKQGEKTQDTFLILKGYIRKHHVIILDFMAKKNKK